MRLREAFEAQFKSSVIHSEELHFVLKYNFMSPSRLQPLLGDAPQTVDSELECCKDRILAWPHSYGPCPTFYSHLSPLKEYGPHREFTLGHSGISMRQRRSLPKRRRAFNHLRGYFS